MVSLLRVGNGCCNGSMDTGEGDKTSEDKSDVIDWDAAVFPDEINPASVVCRVLSCLFFALCRCCVRVCLSASTGPIACLFRGSPSAELPICVINVY